MKGQIYKVTHKKSGRVYIGQTIGELSNKLASLKGYKTEIGKIIRQSKGKSFEIETLVFANSYKKLNELEKFYIAEYKSYDPKYGFNKMKGGGKSRVVKCFFGRQMLTKQIVLKIPTVIHNKLNEIAMKDRRSVSDLLYIHITEITSSC